MKWSIKEELLALEIINALIWIALTLGWIALIALAHPRTWRLIDSFGANW